MDLHVEIRAGKGKTVPEDVLRCLATLYGTRPGELQTDRAFGISREMVDKNVPVAQQMLRREIILKTLRYEPRVRVLDVVFEAENPKGILNTTVVIEIVEDT